MKRLPALPILPLLAWGLTGYAPATQAGLPQPMCVYYGQACDGFGLPYLADADVILRRGTHEIARHPIRESLAPGVNFALYVHLDDGRSGREYSPRAVRSGDLVSISIRDAAGERIIMENQAVPPVRQPGDLILINATAAEDRDRDGLPDPWEWELAGFSDGGFQTLEDVHGGDDFDGDGMTNLQEYYAGTFAFLAEDHLSIERIDPTPNHRLRLTSLSVRGKLYSVSCTASLADGAWRPCPVSTTEDGAFSESPVEGTGDWISLYVPLDASTWFFRLEAR
jgi:hypothetical protein